MHRHSRSTSRARSSSAKAREEIKEIDQIVKDSKHLSCEYMTAVDAIDQAASQNLIGSASPANLDAVRNQMVPGVSAGDFSASKGARAAASAIGGVGRPS